MGPWLFPNQDGPIWEAPTADDTKSKSLPCDEEEEDGDEDEESNGALKRAKAELQKVKAALENAKAEVKIAKAGHRLKKGLLKKIGQEAQNDLVQKHSDVVVPEEDMIHKLKM